MSKDYYNILGASKNATQDEIKKAFRKKAHQHHPDKGNGDATKFKEINEAYQVLGNADKRKQYDQLGSTFDQAGFGGGQAGGYNWQDFSRNSSYGASGSRTDNVNFDFGDLGDIFGEMFGDGARKGQARQRGSDLQLNLKITFLESVFGVTKTVDLQKNSICSHCYGNGAEPGTKIETCKKCNGRGQLEQTQKTFLGAFRQVVACPDCQGEGKKATTNCKECRGQGIKLTSEALKIEIPAGIDEGQTIRLRGKGEAGLKGASSGDLFVNISVESSNEFTRDNYNILSKKDLYFWQAALGDKVEIKTVDGEVNLKIPAGTPNNKVFILKGRGVPKLRGSGRGDHLVEVVVKVPKKLTREQKKLLEELKKKEI